MNNKIEKEDYPRIIYPAEADRISKDEIKIRGVIPQLVVELENGNKYLLIVFDPVRFQQTIESELKENSYCAESAVIVLPKLNMGEIQKTLKILEKKGFFESLVPVRRKHFFIDEILNL